MFAPRPRIPGQFVTQLKPMLLQKSPGQSHGSLVSSAFLHTCHLGVCVCARARVQEFTYIGWGRQQLTLQTG